MKFMKTIDAYVKSMWSDGRFTSGRTEDGYRGTLNLLAETVGGRDPAGLDRDDLKRFLSRWDHPINPNTKGLHRSHCVSFFDWMLEEGLRLDNPARQTRRPRKRPPQVYKLTRSEVAALRDAVRTTRERRALDLGLFVGLRAQELCGLQGRHFRRVGWVWVSGDIAKGPRGRWVPAPAELSPTWWEIARNVRDQEFVLARVVERFNHRDRVRQLDASRPMAYRSLLRLVEKLGERAGIRAHVHPHLLRHAFGEGMAEHTKDIRLAQALLGHRSVTSTEVYTGAPSMERLAAAVAGFGYGPATPGVTPLGDAAGSLSAYRETRWARP